MFVKLTNTESDLIFHLEKALEEEEIEVYYQPIIHTISGSLCGFEALSRWNHPQFGLLMPSAYIDVLERSRQSYRLDCYVVERSASATPASGRPAGPWCRCPSTFPGWTLKWWTWWPMWGIASANTACPTTC